MKRKLSVGWILLLVICCLITGATGDTNYTPTINNGEVVPGSLTNYTHNHNFIPGRVTKEPTCTQTGTQEYNCNCGVSETRTLPAKGHSWGGWTVTKEATCGQTGTRTRKCSVCGQTETDTIATQTTPSSTAIATQAIQSLRVSFRTRKRVRPSPPW